MTKAMNWRKCGNIGAGCLTDELPGGGGAGRIGDDHGFGRDREHARLNCHFHRQRHDGGSGRFRRQRQRQEKSGKAGYGDPARPGE
jgi:hypothetical protein